MSPPDPVPAAHARPARRRRALALALALAAAPAAAGCGSAGGGASTGTTTGTTASAAKGTAGSLRVIGTPQFARPAKSAPVLSGTVTVSYSEITIHPDTLRVRAGTVVRWTNQDPVQHNVTSIRSPQRLASGNFGQGQGFAVKLTRPGVVDYECTNHPASMNGAIEVLR